MGQAFLQVFINVNSIFTEEIKKHQASCSWSPGNKGERLQSLSASVTRQRAILGSLQEMELRWRKWSTAGLVRRASTAHPPAPCHMSASTLSHKLHPRRQQAASCSYHRSHHHTFRTKMDGHPDTITQNTLFPWLISQVTRNEMNVELILF